MERCRADSVIPRVGRRAVVAAFDLQIPLDKPYRSPRCRVGKHEGRFLFAKFGRVSWLGIFCGALGLQGFSDVA